MPGTVHLSGSQSLVFQTLKVRPGVAANNLVPPADHLRRPTPPPLTRRTGTHCSLAMLHNNMAGSAGDPEANNRPAGCQAMVVTGAWPGRVKERTQLVLGREITLAGSRVQSIIPTRHPTANSAEPHGRQERHEIPRCPSKYGMELVMVCLL